jgi:hypothetical protein
MPDIKMKCYNNKDRNLERMKKQWMKWKVPSKRMFLIHAEGRNPNHLVQ